MKFRLETCVQHKHNFAIVDEVDSILIDEARTPLIISGPSESSTDHYYRVNGMIPRLIRGEVIEGKEPGEKYTTGDYTVDEKHKSVALTEEGVTKVERLLGCGNLYDPANIILNHATQQAQKAHLSFHRDKLPPKISLFTACKVVAAGTKKSPSRFRVPEGKFAVAHSSSQELKRDTVSTGAAPCRLPCA